MFIVAMRSILLCDHGVIPSRRGLYGAAVRIGTHSS